MHPLSIIIWFNFKTHLQKIEWHSYCTVLQQQHAVYGALEGHIMVQSTYSMITGMTSDKRGTLSLYCCVCTLHTTRSRSLPGTNHSPHTEYTTTYCTLCCTVLYIQYSALHTAQQYTVQYTQRVYSTGQCTLYSTCSVYYYMEKQKSRERERSLMWGVCLHPLPRPPLRASKFPRL